MILPERSTLNSSLLAKHWYLIVFAFVTFAVFILPPPSVFISSLPDTLRPESVFLLVFLTLRIILSGKLVKFSLECSFLMAICLMAGTIFWAVAGLGIHFMVQDFIDIYSFLIYWAVFRYGYELTVRYKYDFISTLTFILFLIVIVQFVFVLGQRMNIDAVMNISSWWSHDYDAVPWLRRTRPNGMTSNAITLSILMVMYFLYFLGQTLSLSSSRPGILLSRVGLVLSALIIILTKSRTGFVLFLLVLLLFALFAGSYLRRVIASLLKGVCVMLVVVIVMFGIAKVAGYRGEFVLISAATELVGRLENSVRYGLREKEGAVGRLNDARTAFAQLRESPYVGIGPAHSLGKSWFHSSYITLLRRYGAVGLFVYLAPYLLVLLQSGRYFVCWPGRSNILPLVLTCSGLCILVGGITNYTFIGEWQINYIFWLLAGVVVATQRGQNDTLDHA